MIKRILIRENLSFKELELEISKGLTVFTGLSGAGKSVLLRSILSAFALGESEAKFVEIQLDDELALQQYGIKAEKENVFKLLRDKSVKYFINNQSIAKKSLMHLSKTFVTYLSARENEEFHNEKLLKLLDALEHAKNSKFKNFLENFQNNYRQFVQISQELANISQEENKIEQLKELANIHIEKISKINPKLGEYEQLLELKKKLSKRDKLEMAWNKASAIFDLERTVVNALNLSGKDATFFSECLNELRIIAENEKMQDLDFDIEKILDRIEDLSSLIRRYESIENALELLEMKKKELAHYENLIFKKKEVQKKLEKMEDAINEGAQSLSQIRMKNLIHLEHCLNHYLKNLYISNLHLELKHTAKITALGRDELILNIDTANLKKLSSGELNRLRLALIATEAKILNSGKGIIFLDEIDANLSGKEAMSIANVLNELSCFYQIFAISHLPQLSSRAHNHFLVEKNDAYSRVKKLQNDERIRELARMVSGEEITDEALEFAKTLFKN